MNHDMLRLIAMLSIEHLHFSCSTFSADAVIFGFPGALNTFSKLSIYN